MTSLLTDTIHSHLNLKVGDQGLTILLPSSSKRPKITSIDRWLHAFAVVVSVYPSRAVDFKAYQQLVRDGTFTMLSSEDVPPITFLLSMGNCTSSSTSISLRASQNVDTDPVAAPIIFLMPALYLLVGLGMPYPIRPVLQL